MTVDLVLYLILAIMAVVSALNVITRKSPITATMFLVMHFLSLGGIYLTLQAQFMAVIQILVYAGAIMVLVVFVIMLLNLGKEEPLSEKLKSRQAAGVALGMVLGGAIIYAVTKVFHDPSAASKEITQNGTIQAVGKALFTTYVFPFEMASLVLLAAAIGAVVLTKRHIE